MEPFVPGTLGIPQLNQVIGLAAGLAHSLLLSRPMQETIKFGEEQWQLAYRVALRVLGTPDQAEDAAQEALLNAYSARNRFAGRSRPESWLYRIAHNTAISFLRRPHHRRRCTADVTKLLESPAHTERQGSPEQAAMESQLAECLDECLGGLSDRDRIAFTHRFLLGTTERELGTLLGISPNAAKQRAFRARTAVRSRFIGSEFALQGAG